MSNYGENPGEALPIILNKQALSAWSSGDSVLKLLTRVVGNLFDQSAQVVAVPASAAASGRANQVSYDATHFYVCVAANTWVRGTLASW